MERRRPTPINGHLLRERAMRVNVLCQPLPYIAACLAIGSVGGFIAALVGIAREKRGGDCGNGCPCG